MPGPSFHPEKCCRRIVFSGVVSLLLLSGCGALGGSVTGQVIDPIAQSGVSAAKVTITTKAHRYVFGPCPQPVTLREQTTDTRSDGHFSSLPWVGLPAGITFPDRSYAISVSKDGYREPTEKEHKCICTLISPKCGSWWERENNTFYLVPLERKDCQFPEACEAQKCLDP